MSVTEIHSRTRQHTASRANPPAGALAPNDPVPPMLNDEAIDDLHLYFKALTVAVFALQDIRVMNNGLSGKRAAAAMLEIVSIRDRLSGVVLTSTSTWTPPSRF